MTTPLRFVEPKGKPKSRRTDIHPAHKAGAGVGSDGITLGSAAAVATAASDPASMVSVAFASLAALAASC